MPFSGSPQPEPIKEDSEYFGSFIACHAFSLLFSPWGLCFGQPSYSEEYYSFFTCQSKFKFGNLYLCVYFMCFLWNHFFQGVSPKACEGGPFNCEYRDGFTISVDIHKFETKSSFKTQHSSFWEDPLVEKKAKSGFSITKRENISMSLSIPTAVNTYMPSVFFIASLNKFSINSLFKLSWCGFFGSLLFWGNA